MSHLYWLGAACLCIAGWTIPDVYQWRFALRPSYRWSVGVVLGFCLGGAAGAWLGG